MTGTVIFPGGKIDLGGSLRRGAHTSINECLASLIIVFSRGENNSFSLFCLMIKLCIIVMTAVKAVESLYFMSVGGKYEIRSTQYSY